MSRRKSIDTVKRIYAEKQLEFLEDNYRGINKKYLTKCLVCGYTSYRGYEDVVYKNSGCPSCKGVLKYTLDQVHSILAQKQLVFRDETYKNALTRHTIQCLRCNSIFKTTLSCIKDAKYGCKACSISYTAHTKYDIDFVKNTCAARNFEFLDTTYKDVTEKHYFKCLQCGYKFTNSFANIIKKETKCKKCIGHVKHDTQYIKELYLAEEISFLEKEYKNNLYNHELQCLRCNHIFKAAFNNFKRDNTGCPKCKYSKNEKITLQALADIFPNLEITKKKIPCPDLVFQKTIICDAGFKINSKEIIVEYNGKQHYEPVPFNGTNNQYINLERQQKRDEWLRSYCASNDILLIEIDGRIYKNKAIKPYLISQLTKHNILT